MIIESIIRILCDFLQDPEDLKKLNLFAKLCLQHAKGYIAYNHKVGRSIPRRSNDLQKDMLDLAVEIISEYLKPKNNRPAHMLFKYLENMGYVDFQESRGEELYCIYRRQLFGFVKQELPKMDINSDPMISRISRQIIRSLDAEEYITNVSIGDTNNPIFLSTNVNNLRVDKSVIPYIDLVVVAEKAIQKSKTIPQLCRAIFEFLNESKEFANFVSKSEFKRAIIDTYSRFIEFETLPVRLLSPKDAFALKHCSFIKDETVEFIRKAHLDRFIEKNKIDKKQADLLCRALDEFLDDIITKGEYDKLPKYFYRAFPGIDSQEYQKRFKNIWDTTIRRALNYFVSGINNDSTMGNIGS